MQSIGAVAALVAGLAIPAAAATGAMPVAQQNALVEKYCAVCHNDANKTGGLSLENFDAAHPDPSVVAMMVSKLKDGAFGASGVPLPDRTTQDALLSALSAEAAGASEWTVNRTQDPEAPILTASILREILSTANAGEPNVYRLALTCRVDTREAEMQLAWAPGDVPGSGGTMSAAGDGKAPLTVKVNNGEGAAILSMPLPEQMLTISNLFPGETVVFPFGGLAQSVRQTLSTCFTGR